MEEKQKFFLNLVLVQSSAACSETVTFPIDNIKTRLQIHHGRVSALHTVKESLRSEGVSGFYNGLSAAVMRHWVYTGCRISLYDNFRGKAREITGMEDPGIWWKCLSGGSAGGLGQLIATPFDLIKVRLIADRNRSQYSGFWDCVIKIYRSEGRAGFYRGWLPSVQRAAMVNIGELSTYDESKRIILRNTTLEDGIAVHTLASFMSGLVSSAISTPIDVVKSRIMANPSVYRGSLHCIATTVQAEGVRALGKGFLLVRPSPGPIPQRARHPHLVDSLHLLTLNVSPIPLPYIPFPVSVSDHTVFQAWRPVSGARRRARRRGCGSARGNSSSGSHTKSYALSPAKTAFDVVSDLFFEGPARARRTTDGRRKTQPQVQRQTWMIQYKYTVLLAVLGQAGYQLLAVAAQEPAGRSI